MRAHKLFVGDVEGRRTDDAGHHVVAPFKEILIVREATGVTVPLPYERGPVTDALMASVVLKRRGPKDQLVLDLRLDDGTKAMEKSWRDVSENEKKSRARFAQNAMKPQEVAPEWEKVRTLLGSPADAKAFIERAMTAFKVPLEQRKSVLLAHVDALDAGLRDRLAQHNMTGSVRLAMAEPAPSGTALLTRMHPLTATLAESLVEASLDPESMSGLEFGRVGAWPMAAVQQMTRLALLRLRFKLTIHARRERLLLAEEAALVAFQDGRIVAAGEEARSLLNTPAAANLATPTRDRFVAKAKADLPGLIEGPIARFVRSRAEDLMQDHARLRAAAGSASRVTVEAVLPQVFCRPRRQVSGRARAS
jgi:hypothetical protein